jgi:hypothetical protein
MMSVALLFRRAKTSELHNTLLYGVQYYSVLFTRGVLMVDLRDTVVDDGRSRIHYSFCISVLKIK